MIKSLRFGVFAQLVVSFVFAIVLTIGAAFIGVYNINSFNDGVEDVVLSRLPALSFAYQLGQQSEAIVATAPSMVRSLSQTERETVSYRTEDQLRTLNETILTIRAFDLNIDLLDIIDEAQEGLEVNFARLDQIVSDDINVKKKIQERHRAVQKLVKESLSDIQNNPDENSNIRVLIELLLLIETQTDLAGFNESVELFERMLGTTKETLPANQKDRELIAKIESLAIGDEGLLALHQRHFELSRRIIGLLAVNETLSSRFVYSVNALIQEMTGDIEEQGTSFQEFVDQQTTFLTLVVFFSVCIIGVLASTRVKSILRRLSSLKNTMNNQALGQDVQIDTAGNDEISDMANALSELVEKLSHREQEIRSNEERFRDLVEASSDWFWETDEQLRFTSVSNRFFEITGFDRTDIMGMSRLEVMRDFGEFNDPDLQIELHARQMEKQISFRDLNYFFKGKNGKSRLFKVSGKPIFDDHNVFRGYRGTGADITRESLAESRLKAANDIMPGGIALWDDSNRLVMWNLRFADYYQMIEEHIVVGATFEKLIDEMAKCCVQRAGSDYKDKRMSFRNDPSGLMVEEHLNGRFLQVSEASTNDGGTVTLVTDVTERMNSERRLDKARMDAEQANQAKSRFLASASHDLRQPLHAMGMNISRLEERRLKSVETEAVEDMNIIRNISDSLDALRSLMNTLLDISKLEAGIMKAEKADMNLKPVLQMIANRFTSQAAEKKLRIRMVCPDVAVHTDQVLIERVLSNLMSNAVRYTSNGGVLIGARKRGDYIWIDVIDTGIGIPKDKQQDIFVEFKQLQNPSRDRRKGLGLGLAIVDKMLALLGHPIQLLSNEGHGTRFRIIVPVGQYVKHPDEVAEYSPEQVENKNIRIAIIDDEPDIIHATSELITGWGYGVIAGASAHEIIELMINTDVKPDLILADYRLANHQNGADAIRSIQQFCNEKIPGVIITGDTASDRIRQAKSSGYLLLHKPLKPGKIRQLIRNLQMGRLK